MTPLLYGAGLAIVQEADDLLRGEAERQGWALAAYLARLAGERMGAGDRAGIRGAIDEVLGSNPDLAEIRVQVAGEKEVVAAGAGASGEGEALRFAREIRGGGSSGTQPLGWVTVAFSTRRIEERMRVVRDFLLAATLGLGTLLAFLLLGGLQRVVLGPIRELAGFAAAIGRGEGPPALRRSKRAEFAVLAEALESAREALHSRDRALLERFDSIRSAYLQLESILQSLGEGVLVADAEGIVVLTNRTVAQILGPVDALLRRPLLDLLPKAPETEGGPSPPALPAEGEPPQSWAAAVGRHTFRVSLARIPGSGSGAIRYLAVLRDVTREAEDAAMKNEFVACVSHELRTPLTSILSFTEMLLTMGPDDEEELREFLEIVHREASRMSRLVDDILDIARLEGGTFRLRISTVDPGEVAREVEQAFRAVARDSGIDLASDVAPELPTLEIDRERLAQVLSNLASNAIKFTSIGGRVRLRARRATERDETGDRVGIVFEVEDTGPGIPEADRERIFEKFAQLGDPLVEKPRGTGLGLPISRGIVQRMGGTIRVETAPGKGSVFSVWLPLTTSVPAGPRAPERAKRRSRERSEPASNLSGSDATAVGG
jgi:signal transduction histidine kinase